MARTRHNSASQSGQAEGTIMFKTYRFIAVIVFVPVIVFGEMDVPDRGVLVGLWTPPTVEQIYRWWKPEHRESPDEDIDVYEVRRIYLTGGELAFVAEVGFPQRGRNFARGCLLIRPKLEEARQIEELGKRFGDISYSIDRASCIWTESWASGQGTTHRHKRVLYLDGWNPVILYERKFGDNLGDCGYSNRGRCYQEVVAWTFTDLDRDSRDDLVELVVQKRGADDRQLLYSAKLNWYLIKDGKFVPTEPTTEFDLKLMDKNLFGR